jgi:hypothetical protein
MKYKIIFAFFLLILAGTSVAQRGNDLINGALQGRGIGQGSSSKDTIGFEHRDDAKDSITLSYKFLDSLRAIKLDGDIADFNKYLTYPASQQYLGNHGSAAYSLLFSPIAKAGWDAGFHAYDVYMYTLENTKFYKTTKPYSQLNYQLASGKEQLIKILHTQNPMPNFNFGFEYKLINAPGFFVTQNTNHNSYRIFSNYQGKKKRYAAYFALLGNKMKASENGGIINDSLLSNTVYKRRFAIPVNLGGSPDNDPNPFSTTVNTGNIYKNFTFFLRQTYDIGKKDSIIINDSTTEYLFYSKLRFQHSFTYNSNSFQFRDYLGDSTIYQQWYDTTFKKSTDSFVVTDSWKNITNDFSLLQFPDTKNLNQFILAGARLENIKGTFSSGTKNFYNIILHGEYRNRTRNKLWDILAKGEFYLNGVNSGDYSIYGTLARTFGNRWGNVRLLFNNINRSPSFIYSGISSFNFGNTTSYKKENITIIKVSAENPLFNLSATNYLIANYLFFSGYYKTDQYSSIINLLQLSASKKFKLTKKWNLYSEVTVQQTDGAAPVKLPLIFTRNRLAYEGLFYKNLNLSTGLEVKYYTAYNAYNYSPVMGQFSPQDTATIRNLPDINLFLHFRIKSFTAYLRAENLNTVSFRDGFGFTNNNFAAPHYAYPGFIFRFGIQWGFVN